MATWVVAFLPPSTRNVQGFFSFLSPHDFFFVVYFLVPLSFT
jgi:hypothetical protein